MAGRQPAHEHSRAGLRERATSPISTTNSPGRRVKPIAYRSAVSSTGPLLRSHIYQSHTSLSVSRISHEIPSSTSLTTEPVIVVAPVIIAVAVMATSVTAVTAEEYGAIATMSVIVEASTSALLLISQEITGVSERPRRRTPSSCRS